MVYIPILVVIYTVLVIVGTIVDVVFLQDDGFKNNILISHRAFKKKFPEFNIFGIFIFYVFISILSPIFGIIRLYYYLATIKR